MNARDLSRIASGCPTSYKKRFEREQHLRQHLERRVDALEQERDALRYRLQRAELRFQREQVREGLARQHQLELNTEA